MARDERGGVGVLPLTECVYLPGIREVVCVGAGVGVVLGNVRIERGTGEQYGPLPWAVLGEVWVVW